MAPRPPVDTVRRSIGRRSGSGILLLDVLRDRRDGSCPGARDPILARQRREDMSAVDELAQAAADLPLVKPKLDGQLDASGWAALAQHRQDGMVAARRRLAHGAGSVGPGPSVRSRPEPAGAVRVDPAPRSVLRRHRGAGPFPQQSRLMGMAFAGRRDARAMATWVSRRGPANSGGEDDPVTRS